MRPLLSLLIVLCFSHVAFADDVDSDARKFPNRMEASPPPDNNPKAHVTSVPAAKSGTTGSAESPEESSQMGLGVSIPLGHPKRTAPQRLEEQPPSESGEAP